ncbi:MAG: penicillin-binding transpeptidase domain-containing protein [Solirubrobacteraceae bacterium]
MSTIERLRPVDSARDGSPPQLALRVAILGGIALVMFGIVFFRLWYLQVLTGEQYVQQAKANDQRMLTIPAPRGEILDRSGRPIVTDSVTNAVQILPGSLPAAVLEQAAHYDEAVAAAQAEHVRAIERLRSFQQDLDAATAIDARDKRTRASARPNRAQRAELRSLHRQAKRVRRVPIPAIPASAVRLRGVLKLLSPVIGMSPRAIYERVIAGISQRPYAPVTIKTDAGPQALTILAERKNEFPGVRQEPVAIRHYPYGELAAQILGHVGQISEPELKLKAFRGVQQGTVVGQEGVEFYYDRYLRGRPGAHPVQVNALGQAASVRLPAVQPLPGHSLRLSIDLGLEQEAERALREGIAHAQAAGKPANAGAYVAMDPRNGQILAIGSYPSFNPNIFAKPIPEAEWNALLGNDSNGATGGPLTDRAVNGTYPTGSTFKPITAMAALEGHVITPGETLGPGSCITVGAEQFCNAGKTDYGALPLVEALKVSSDTYFFEVGERANAYGNVIQRKAHELGVGEKTGIDLPEEITGVIPDRKWLAQRNVEESQCRRKFHVSSCGLLAEPGAPWTVGYNMQLAVGQGDLLTDPLQMAVAYSTLANAFMNGGNGHVVRPHLGMEIDNANGALVQTLPFPPVRRVRLNDYDLNLVMEGIHQAASAPGGTSADVWAGWNQALRPVYGKTGTAQHEGKEDQSWYMCYVADPQGGHPIVIAVTVEQGGFGAETAAPTARLIAAKWFSQPEKFVAGAGQTRVDAQGVRTR